MKIRNDYVSNSSSSSFIVINNTNLEDIKGIYGPLYRYETINLPNYNLGNTEFGWEFEMYSDFGDKLNFCALLISDMSYYFYMPEQEKQEYLNTSYNRRYVEFSMEHYEKYRDMLIDVCKSEFGLDVNILTHSEIDKAGMFAYIDHQSSIFDDPDNGRMFEDEYSLINFLSSSDSYIKTGNDNTDDPPTGWYDDRY